MYIWSPILYYFAKEVRSGMIVLFLILLSNLAVLYACSARSDAAKSIPSRIHLPEPSTLITLNKLLSHHKRPRFSVRGHLPPPKELEPRTNNLRRSNAYEHGSLIEMIFLVHSHRRLPRAFSVALRCSMAIDPRFVGSSRTPAICKSLPFLP